MRNHRWFIGCVILAVPILAGVALAITKGADAAVWAAPTLIGITLAGMMTLWWFNYRSHRHDAEVAEDKAQEALTARKKLRRTCDDMISEVQAVSPERAARFEDQLSAIHEVGAPIDAIFYTMQRANARLLSERRWLDRKMMFEYCRESFAAAAAWYQKIVPELYFATPAGLKHHLSLMSGALRAYAVSLGQYEKQFDVSAAWQVYARLVLRLRAFQDAWPQAELSEVALLQAEVEQFGTAVEKIGDISKRFLQEAETELADALQGALSRLDGLTDVSLLLPRLRYKWAFWRARRFLDRSVDGRLTAAQAVCIFTQRLNAIEGVVPEELIERDQERRRTKVSETPSLSRQMQDDAAMVSSILSATAAAIDTSSSSVSTSFDSCSPSAGDGGSAAVTC